MSIFQRLYRIARANIDRRLNPSDPNAKESDFDFGNWKGSSSSGPDDDRNPRGEHSSQDPKLAQYYANLEIPYGSDLETVRKAWKELLKKYHPDLHSNDPEKKKVAQELSRELNHAYQALAKHLKHK